MRLARLDRERIALVGEPAYLLSAAGAIRGVCHIWVAAAGGKVHE